MFTVPPEPKVTAFTEQLTELKCVVEGFPTPKVEWRRQGNKELPLGRHYIRNNNLYLQNPIKEDEDIYMCHASTPAGSVMGGTEVTVETYGKISARIVYSLRSKRFRGFRGRELPREKRGGRGGEGKEGNACRQTPGF